jgi:Flp pilus assembly pilin Flp
MLKNFWFDQNGAVVSIELILIITIAVLALVVGWSEVAVAVNTELNDISNAVGALNQSYAFSGFTAYGNGKVKSSFGGSCYIDSIDDCDNNMSCDIVCGIHHGGGESHR